MSDTPRNKVNILSVCAANLADAFAKIEAAKKARKEAEDQVSAIKSRHQAEMDAANLELSKIATLIQDNEREGVPTEKLERKSSDIKDRIKKSQASHSQSAELDAAVAAIQKAEAELKSAEDLHEHHKAREAMASALKVAYDANSSYGALEAPEYETLDEALDEYVASIPLVVSISEELSIDKVGMWQVPGAKTPFQAELFAKDKVAYRYNRLPKQVEWLSKFTGTEYASMPRSGETRFNVEGVVFVIGSSKSPKTADEATGHEWMGKMTDFFPNNKPSIYSPDGINYQSDRGFYARSGLCYVKSEGKFYTLWSNKFPSIEMVPGKVQKPDRWGNMQTEDGLVPKGLQADVSKLLEPLYPFIAKRIEKASEEFKNLSKAKTPLAVRLKEAVEKVGVTESTFESRGKRLSEAEIAKEVGAYWEAFINSPWESTILGDVAMIKHLCERKIETPHVWSHQLKGHYGLRVRTRDHDWILAQVYCAPKHLSPKSPISPDEVVYMPDGYVKVGPCFINILGRDR
jgi:ribosomal protein L24E